MGVTQSFAESHGHAEQPAHPTRALVVSGLVVLAVAAIAAWAITQAFADLGGNLNKAGVGAWVSLGLSLVALVAALLFLLDFVYQLVAGVHLRFSPIAHSTEHEPHVLG